MSQAPAPGDPVPISPRPRRRRDAIVPLAILAVVVVIVLLVLGPWFRRATPTVAITSPSAATATGLCPYEQPATPSPAT